MKDLIVGGDYLQKSQSLRIKSKDLKVWDTYLQLNEIWRGLYMFSLFIIQEMTKQLAWYMMKYNNNGRYMYWMINPI